jgi:hypothetical protein
MTIFLCFCLLLFLLIFTNWFYKLRENFEDGATLDATHWLRYKILKDEKLVVNKILSTKSETKYKKTKYGKQIDKVLWFFSFQTLYNIYEYIAVVEENNNQYRLLDFQKNDSVSNYDLHKLYKGKYKKKYIYTTGLFPHSYLFDLKTS